ncbi:MAG: hypothetical protein EOO65_00415 [Methanosarcinales archaeon]|nr:MAG: hypothetical protein EOO65_00415 [Methanosarcinales archaeon]
MAAICALVAAAVEPLHPAAHARLQHVSPHETSAFATDALLLGALAQVDGVSTPDASSHQPADDELVAPPQQGGADEPSANATEPDAQTDGAQLTRDHGRIVAEEPAVSVDTLSGSGNDLVAPADVQALDTLLENPVAPAEAGELSNAAAPSIPGIYALNKEDGSAASHVQSPEHDALQTLGAVDDRDTAMLLEQHDDHVVPDNVANNSDTSNAHVDEGAMPHGRLAFASISSTDPEPRAHGAHVGEHEDQHQLPFATVAQPPENMRDDIAYLEGVNNVDVRATVHEPEPQQHRAGKSVLVAPPLPDVDVQDGDGVYVPSGAESLAVPSVSIDTESVDAYEGHTQGIRVVHRSSGGLPFAGKERQCDNTTIVVPRSDIQPVLVLGSEKRRGGAWSHTEDEFSALPHDGVDTHDLSRDETSRTAADPRSTLHSESTASELPPVPNAEHAPNKRVEAEKSATVVTPAVVHAEGHEAAAAPVPQHERIEQNENDLPDGSAVTSMTASGLFLEPEAIDAIRGQRQSDDDDAHSLLTDDASKASARENDSKAAVENEHDALAMNSAAGRVKESNERNYNPALIVEVAGIDNNLVSREEPLPLTDNSINRFDETVSQGDADDLESPPEHAHNEEIFTSSSILATEPRDEDVGATEDENARNGFDHPSALATDEPFANDEAARGTRFHTPPVPLDTVAQSINNPPPPEQVQTQLGADPIASSTPGARPAHPGEADADATLATATEPTAQLKARAVSPDHSLFIMSSGLELPLQGQGVGNAGADGGGLQVGAQTQPPVEPTAAPPPAVIVHSPGLALARDELVTPVEAEMFDLASVRHRMVIPHRHVRASKSRLLSHKEVDAGHEAAYATGHAHISFMDIDDTVVTAGHAHACAITADAQHMDEDAIGGPVVCWGDEEANVLNPPQVGRTLYFSERAPGQACARSACGAYTRAFARRACLACCLAGLVYSTVCIRRLHLRHHGGPCAAVLGRLTLSQPALPYWRISPSFSWCYCCVRCA